MAKKGGRKAKLPSRALAASGLDPGLPMALGGCRQHLMAPPTQTPSPQHGQRDQAIGTHSSIASSKG